MFPHPFGQEQHTYDEVGVVGSKSPNKRKYYSHRCQILGRNGDEVSQIARKNVLCKAASTRGRAYEHHDPHYELARKDEEMVVYHEKGQ